MVQVSMQGYGLKVPIPVYLPRFFVVHLPEKNKLLYHYQTNQNLFYYRLHLSHPWEFLLLVVLLAYLYLQILLQHLEQFHHRIQAVE